MNFFPVQIAAHFWHYRRGCTFSPRICYVQLLLAAEARLHTLISQALRCQMVGVPTSLQAMRLMNMTCFEHRQLVEKQAALKESMWG